MAHDLAKWDSDNTLYLFTSLTAGSSHVITATSRMETILKANRIPFTYIDTATNDEARKLYMRRAQGKKFPLLVKEGFVLGVSANPLIHVGRYEHLTPDLSYTLVASVVVTGASADGQWHLACLKLT